MKAVFYCQFALFLHTIQYNISAGRLPVKKSTNILGLMIMAVGGMILVTCFLPPTVLVIVLSILLILVGFLVCKV